MLNKVSPQSMTDEHLLPAALLEMGDSLNFIEVRKHTLRKEIKDSKLSAAAGKFSGLGAIVGGAALAALSNPLGWLIGGCGITAYTLSVFGQWLQTGKVHPMPLSSKSQDERDEDLAGSTVSGEGDSSTGRTAIHEDAAYLSDREKTEYELLHFAPQGLMSALNSVPPAQRWACYQFLVDAFAAGTIGDYANPQTLKDVLGKPSVYTSHLPEASKRFPQYGLPSAETPQSQNESLPAAPTATASPGAQTRLGAVTVPASPVAQPSIPTALSIIVSDPYQSRAWFGAQRTGKSYLAAVASRQISESLGCKVYHINLASFGDEDSYYWSHAVKSLTCDLSSLDGYEASQMIRSAIELVKEFYSTQNAILIVDEIAYCGSSVAAHKDALAELMRIVADKITTLSSSGKKRMQAIWTIAPEFVAGAMSQDAKAVKKLKLCYVSINPNTSVNWQGQTIGFDWELFNQIKANYTISDPVCVPRQERICFIGSDWVPVGELPDLKKGKSTKPETPIVDPVAHLENSLKASDDDSDELAIRAEIKRFLSVNQEGSKPRDLSNKARSPVRKMAVDDIRFILEVMELEGDIYAVEDTFFLNRL